MESQLPEGPLPLAQSLYLTLLQKICEENLSTGPPPGSDLPAAEGTGLKLSDPFSDRDKAQLSSSPPLSACRSQGDNIIWCGSRVFVDPTVGSLIKLSFPS